MGVHFGDANGGSSLGERVKGIKDVGRDSTQKNVWLK